MQSSCTGIGNYYLNPNRTVNRIRSYDDRWMLKIPQLLERISSVMWDSWEAKFLIAVFFRVCFICVFSRNSLEFRGITFFHRMKYATSGKIILWRKPVAISTATIPLFDT